MNQSDMACLRQAIGSELKIVGLQILSAIVAGIAVMVIGSIVIFFSPAGSLGFLLLIIGSCIYLVSGAMACAKAGQIYR